MGMHVGRLGRLGALPYGAGSGGGDVIPPAFPPQVAGTNADIAADFVGGKYWASGAAQASFSAWMTAIGGTFSRISTATYIDAGILKTAAVNTPRFPAGFGIRLTAAVTNILPQSNAFTTTWSSLNTPAVPNAGISPDGTTNAWSIKSVVGNTNQTFQILAGAVTTAPQTLSIYAKQDDSPTFILAAYDNTAANYIFQVSVIWQPPGGPIVATINNPLGTNVSSVVTQLANGWFRIDLTYTATSTAGNQLRFILQPETSVAANCTGKGNFFYGAQITNSGFGQDYVPTTTVAVTQAADSLSFPYTQTTFSLLQAINGQFDPGSNTYLAGIGIDGPLAHITPNPNISTYNSSVGVLGANSWIGGSYSVPHKVMVAGSPSGRFVTNDGVAVKSDATALLNTVPATMQIGARNNAGYSYGNINSFAIWSNLVAPAADMQRLTTLTLPSWLPLVGGAPDGYPPNLYANTIGNGYWLNGQTYATFSAWFTAIGGTFTRASTATYIEGGVVKTAAANTARFPAGLGIRLTGPVTNIWLQSNSFTTAPWNYGGAAPQGVATPNSGISPDGTNNAWLFTASIGTSAYIGQITAGLITLAPQTATIFAKQGTAPVWTLQVLNQSQGAATIFSAAIFWNGASPPTFNPTAGPAGSAVSGVATSLANGWWRFDVTYTAAGPSVAGDTLRVFFTAESTGVNTGLSTYFYGAQVTNSAFGQDYVPTTTVSATQAADNMWVPQTAAIPGGTLAASGAVDGSAFGVIECIAAFNNSSGVYIAGSGFLCRLANVQSYTVGGNATTVQVNGPIPPAPYKAAAVYNTSTTLQRVVLPAATNENNTNDFTGVGAVRIQIGAQSSAPALPYYGNMKSFGYWPIDATVAQAQALLGQLP